MKDQAYIIIGGPQASGKSVAQRHIGRTYRNIVVLREAAQVLLEGERQKGIVLGGALVDREFETRVLQFDLERMRNITHKPSNDIYVDESNIFTVAHARAKNMDLAEMLFLKYRQALSSFSTGVVFIHVTPEVSWRRREPAYVRRYQGSPDFEDRMKRSKEYIFQLYRHLTTLYQALPYPKQQVEGSVPFYKFEKDVETAFEKVCQGIGTRFERRLYVV